MGQIVKQVSENRTRYYWYPGEKRDWVWAGRALLLGAAAFGALLLATRSMLVAVCVGTAVTLGLCGFNFGRRDLRAVQGFPQPGAGAGRRSAVAHAGRALWRGSVQGAGAAVAAVLIANLSAGGLLANWVLPVVPVLTGALAHQAGMLSERLGRPAGPKDLPPVPSRQADETGPLPPAPRTRDPLGSYGDSATTVADIHPPNTPTSTGQPTSTAEDR
jgi:hypothetical protein